MIDDSGVIVIHEVPEDLNGETLTVKSEFHSGVTWHQRMDSYVMQLKREGYRIKRDSLEEWALNSESVDD